MNLKYRMSIFFSTLIIILGSMPVVCLNTYAMGQDNDSDNFEVTKVDNGDVDGVRLEMGSETDENNGVIRVNKIQSTDDGWKFNDVQETKSGQKTNDEQESNDGRKVDDAGGVNDDNGVTTDDCAVEDVVKSDKMDDGVIGGANGVGNVAGNDAAVFSKNGRTTETDLDESTNLVVENTLDGSILISVKVINNDKEDTEITDQYKVTIRFENEEAQTGKYRINTYNSDGSIAEATEDIDYIDGVIKEVIRVNQKVMVPDAPTGTKYRVSEELPEGYETYEVIYEVVRYTDGEMETMPGVHKVFDDSTAMAMIMNYLESGNLKIKKEVVVMNGNSERAKSQTAEFILRLYREEGDTEALREESFELKHGEIKEIDDIPVGWYYEIVESAQFGFNDDEPTAKTGFIRRGDKNEVVFRDNYRVDELGDELINKQGLKESSVNEIPNLAMEVLGSGGENTWRETTKPEFAGLIVPATGQGMQHGVVHSDEEIVEDNSALIVAIIAMAIIVMVMEMIVVIRRIFMSRYFGIILQHDILENANK